MNDNLDDMKNYWQNAPAQSEFDPQQIEALIAKRSKNALTSIRTNLFVEFGFGIFLLVLLLFAATQAKSESARMALLQLVFLLGPFFVFYFLAIKALNKDISLNCPLHQMLQESIRFWQTALRIYFWGGVLLLPIVFIAVRLLRFQVMGTGNIQFFTGSTGVILLKSAFGWLLFSILLWGLVRFSYWQHLEKLKNCLKEIERTE